MMRRRLSRTALALAAAALVGVMATGTAQAGSVTYVFDYPAIGGPGVQHDAVATLTLTEIAGGVQFLLEPDWTVVGTDAQWDELQLAYKGPTSGLTFNDLGAAIIDSWDGSGDTAHSGYKPDERYMEIHWDNTGQNHHFDYSHGTSSWSFLGVALTDFTETAAWADGKISPIHGVLSGQGIKGDSNNWVSVAGIQPAIPEPSTYAMLLAGLGLMGLVARRRTRR